jgi:hypothetical protein
MSKLLIAIIAALWLFTGFFFYSAWIAIWGDDLGSQAVFTLLWGSALLAFIEPEPSTMEHDS